MAFRRGAFRRGAFRLRAFRRGLVWLVFIGASVPCFAADIPLKQVFFGTVQPSQKALTPQMARATSEGQRVDEGRERAKPDDQPLDFLAVIHSARELGLLSDVPAKARASWQQMFDSAAQLNHPGNVTTFAGIEHTTSGSCGQAHRLVIFQSDEVAALPIRALESMEPQDLWLWMDQLRARGVEAMSIPYLSSDSTRCGFAADRSERGLTHREVFELMVRNEPLLRLSPDDALRRALAEGVRSFKATPGNPYTFGVIGAGNKPPVNAVALTGVWAEENSREAIYAALRRRETFATSGTRIALRMHAGFRFPDNLFTHEDSASLLRKRGVPMGGKLRRGRGPLMIAVQLQDTYFQEKTQPSHRVQVVKVWIESGSPQESVFDITGSSPIWSDPHFDSARPASYYVRVLEDAERGGSANSQTPSLAVTSPVWYVPER